MSERARPSDEARDRAHAFGVFAALAALYWGGRSLGLGAGDGPEHALSALTWGVSRPPGYPLYVALAHAFALLPLGPALGRVSGLSALLSAAAAALFFRLLRRWGASLPAALAATAALALSPLWWHYSEVPEVRALNHLLALGSAWLAAGLTRRSTPRAWAALGAVVGLGLSHHPTFALALPALAVPVLAAKPDARRWGVLAAAAAAGAAAPYVLLGLRLSLGAPPVFNPDAVSGWSGVLGLALRRGTGGLFSMASGSAPRAETAFILFLSGLRRLGGAAWNALTPVGLALAAAGAWLGWKTRRGAVVFCALWFLCAGPAFVALSSPQMTFGDPDYLRAIFLRFDLLPLIALFALAGLGADALLGAKPLAWALAAAAALAPLLLRPMWLGAEDPLGAYARALIADSGPRDMILLNSDDSIFATQYLDLVEHAAGDRVFLVTGRFHFAPYAEQLRARHPDLVLPRDANGLSLTTKEWLRLNPGRALYGEATLRDRLTQISTSTAPSGLLIRLEAPPARPGDAALQAGRLAAEFSSVFPSAPSRAPRSFTQEIYIVTALTMMAQYDGARLTRPEDAKIRAELGEAVSALRWRARLPSAMSPSR